MRRYGYAALVLVALAGWPAVGLAGNYTVTADDAQVKALAAQTSFTPQQLLQKVVDTWLKSQQQAEINRKVTACRSGTDDKACSEIPGLVKKLGK